MRFPAIYLMFIFIVMLCSNIQAQTQPKEIYNKEFDWKIIIPEGFKAVDSATLAKMQQRGTTMIENTIEEKVENHAITIFSFRSDLLHYFEANYQPFDTTTDGDFLEICKAINEVMYSTFKTQMAGAQLDSVYSSEVIDGLIFHKFKITITIPGKLVMNAYMYNRLFDKRELTVSIIAVDKKKEQLLLDALKNSKFGKQ